MSHAENTHKRRVRMISKTLASWAVHPIFQPPLDRQSPRHAFEVAEKLRLPAKSCIVQVQCVKIMPLSK